MADDTERLFVALEARVTQFEREWKRAGQTGTRTFQQLRQNSSRATRQMEQDADRSASRINQSFATISTKVGDYGKAFAAGIWGGVAAGGIAGVAAAVRSVAASFAELSNEAKTAGVNVEDFQRWSYVAEQNRISVDALVDGFKELNLRADEYIQTGKGSAAESFQRLGMSPEEVKERIKDPSAFMLELIDRTRRLKDTAAGVRIFDELLGGSGGEQFVRLIEQGRDGIKATLTEADKMGAVMDENFIRKAEEVDKKFNQIARTIGGTLKSAIVDAVTALSGFISSWNDLNEKSVAGIKAELSVLQQAKDRLETTQPAGGWEDRFAGIFGKDRETQLATINAEMKKYNDELERRQNIKLPVIKDAPPVAAYVPPETKKGSTKKSDEERARERAAKAAEREREAVSKLISDLEFEASLVGKTALQKEQMIAVRRAGAAATDEEKAKIEGLIETTYRQNAAIDASQQTMEELNDAGREFAGTLIDGALSGADAMDVLGNALKRVADRLMNSGLDAIFGGGGIGSIFGGIFGGGKSDPWSGLRLPGFANGTSFAPGGPAWVGERGPEIVNLPRGSQVTPNHMIGQTGGGTQTVKVLTETRFVNDGNFQSYVVGVAQGESEKATEKGIKTFGQSTAFKMLAANGVSEMSRRGGMR
jgi:phage-related tail protein